MTDHPTPHLTDEERAEVKLADTPCCICEDRPAEDPETVLTNKRRDFVAKRLLHLIDRCAGYGGDPAEMACAAADATRALIDLGEA